MAFLPLHSRWCGMKIAIAQMNPVIGSIKHNAEQALARAMHAAHMGVELIIFSELYLSGYPPKDLLLRQDFLESINYWASWLAQKTPIATLIGAPYGIGPSGLAYNSALWCEAGVVSVVAHKHLLPNYNIFDEKRYFCEPDACSNQAKIFKNRSFLVQICEDSWNNHPGNTPLSYSFDPVATSFSQQAIDYYINLSASPYTITKPHKREQIFTTIAKKYGVAVLVAGQVGANDQILFDGHSLVINSAGEIILRAKACEEDLIIWDTTKKLDPKNNLLEPLDLTHRALVMGIRDYVEKCGARGLIIGLSGGIDSALCAKLAVEAVGAQKVRLFYLPSKYSSADSLRDAELMASLLTIKLESIIIEEAVDILRDKLSMLLAQASSKNQDLADQNIQARVRGLILMGAANALDYYMISTSNKSELAVGYGTLYGDMCGALAPIGDLYKTQVYELAKYLDLPQNIINKAPTAELKSGQLDTDSLPDYAILDKILCNYIELNLTPQEIKNKTNLDIILINNIIKMSNMSEYKRRQGPMALMVSERVFGDARRMPIAKQET